MILQIQGSSRGSGILTQTAVFINYPAFAKKIKSNDSIKNSIETVFNLFILHHTFRVGRMCILEVCGFIGIDKMWCVAQFATICTI